MKTEVVSNDLVIQGIIKEVLYSRTEIEFEFENESIKLTILDVIENKIRDQSINKQLCFFPNEKAKFKSGQPYLFQSRFHRYQIKGICTFEHDRNGTLFFSLPEKLTLENYRKTDRSKVRADLAQPTPVFIRSENLHTEGSFVIEDTSAQGYGGQLSVPASFPIASGSVISGQIVLNESLGKIDGKIVSAIPQKSVPGFDTYRIGITQNISDTERPSSERRKQIRREARFQLTLESMLHPGQMLIIDVQDVSISGFSGKIQEGSIFSSIPVGAEFKLVPEKTKVRLVNFSNDKLHFQILRRNAESAIEWVKKLTPIIHPGARCSTKDARELYRIFFQAGAVSNQYLKRHLIHENILVNHLDQGRSSLIHRWFVGGSPNEADAYMSAIRFGNTCWVMGDIAKTSGSTINATSSVRSFFQSFVEFAVQEASIGTLMIFWVTGHQIWKDWYARLQSDLKDLVCSEVKMQYFRLSETQHHSALSNVKSEIIPKEAHQKRASVLAELDQLIQNFLKYAFDFDLPGTGSFAVQEASSLFDRNYIFVENRGFQFLAIINHGQYGLSINRFSDSLFLFPLSHESLQSSINEIVTEISGHLAIQYGCIFPAVRLIHNSICNEGAEMVTLLLYPKAFSEF